MKEFKFVCPTCGQKIEVETSAIGRQLACPGCQSELIIPAVPKEVGEVPAATVVQPKKRAPMATVPAPTAQSAVQVRPPGGVTAIPATPSKAPAPTVEIKASPAVPAVSEVTRTPLKATGSRESGMKGPASLGGTVRAETAEVLKVEPTAPEAAPPAEVSAGSESRAEATPKVVPVPARKAILPEAKTSVTSPVEAPVSPEEHTQVASLTPAVKREIVRSVRRRIADEADWMPRINPAGKYAYAAKDVEGKREFVEVTDPAATRYSVLGAALLELHLRNVTRTATGRADFLDREFLNAIRQAAGDKTGTQEAGPGEQLDEGKNVPPISHAQSLQALDLLEAQYTREIEESAGGARERLEDLRIVHLARKIERKDSVTIEEFCAAMSNELKEINARLAALERPPDSGHDS